ncbi:MAG: hypothetical protein ACODAQ_01030 [Phycisphaeraceae bacterium]
MVVSLRTGPGLSFLIASLAIGAAIFAFIWVGWVLPVIEPLELPRRGTPRAAMQSRLRWQVWLPTYLTGGWVLGSALAAGETFYRRATLDVLVLPVLLSGVLMATVPISAAVGRRFTERYLAFVAQAGHCFDCGYNLRGNPEATSCPECGKAKPARKRNEK